MLPALPFLFRTFWTTRTVAQPNTKATKATSAKIPGLEPEPPRLAVNLTSFFSVIVSMIELTSVTAYAVIWVVEFSSRG